MNNDKKTCGNCKYFCQHFVWSANIYATTNCGHCLKNYKNCKSPFFKHCADWEIKTEEKTIKEKHCIKSTLSDMAKKIDMIIARLDFYDDN